MPRSSRPSRFAIYTRQSTEPRDGMSSCEAQFHLCMDVARARSHSDDAWIGERFDDQGVSGRSLDRPALNRLRERVQQGDVDRVYVMALDRLSRSLTDTSLLFEEFDRAGVDVHIAYLPELDQRPESRLLRHVLASFAQFEREMIATRIAETRAYLKKHGRRLAGPAPYGYDADRITKQLVPNRTEARRVRAIFKRAANGQTPSEIARRIDHLGWRTKQWVSDRSGKTVGGGRWTARQVLSVLRNPVYIGRFADRGSTRDGCHKPLVDVETFEAVKCQLDARRTRSVRSRQRSKHDHFSLRKKIICPQCRRFLGTYMITTGKGPARIVYRYYRCRSSAGGRPPCKGVQYSATEVERVLRELLAQDDRVWASVLPDKPTCAKSRVSTLRAAWAGLDLPAQDRLMAKIIDRVEIRRANSELRVTFAEELVESLRPAFSGLLDDHCEMVRDDSE